MDYFWKEAEYEPWECLYINLIGPYKIWTKKHGHKIPKLRCVTQWSTQQQVGSKLNNMMIKIHHSS